MIDKVNNNFATVTSMDRVDKDTNTTKPEDNSVFGSNKNALVIDFFDQDHAVTNIGGKSYDLSHGELVTDVIKETCPKDTKIYTCQIQNSFPKIEDLQKLGIGAVNISFGCDLSYAEMSDLTKTQITPENLAQNKDLIKKAIANNAQNSANKSKENSNYIPTKSEARYAYMQNSINELENYTGSGIKVFVADGNSGRNSINSNVLSNGVEVVGSTNTNGESDKYSSDSSLTTTKEVGDYGVSTIKGQGFGLAINGVIPQNASIKDKFGSTLKGFADKINGKSIKEVQSDPNFLVRNLGEDGVVVTNKNNNTGDIFSETIGKKLTISDGVSDNFDTKIEGTSFASPRALGEYLKRKTMIDNSLNNYFNNQNK